MKRSFWFVAPAALHLVVFALGPILFALGLSLFDWKVLAGTSTFVGVDNFVSVFKDASFLTAIGRSARFALMSVPSGMVAALAVALLVYDQSRLSRVLRTVYYVPAVCSAVAVSMVWIYVYLPQNGLINATSALFGMKSVDFLNDPNWAMPALAFMSIWVGLGPRMIVYIAGLVGIPPVLYEAATLDGASRWQQFKSLTWPLLAPTHLFVLVTGTISAFQLFTPVYMMTKGGPLETTDVAGYHIYTEAWRKFHLSTAAAQSAVLMAVIALFALLQFRLLRKQLAGAVSQ